MGIFHSNDFISKFRDSIPPFFAGTALDNLTGMGYRWRTLQNEKSRGDVPPEVFVRSGGRKLLIDRDAFLQFWAAKLRGGEAPELNSPGA